MSNAARQVKGTITNSSERTLTLSTPVPEFPSGQWEGNRVPEGIRVIPPGATVSFVVESTRPLTGCEGSLNYEVSGPVWQNWLIYWNNPYIGYNTYRQVTHGVSSLVTTNGDKENDDQAWVAYQFTDESLTQSPSAPTPSNPEVYGGAAACEQEAHVSVGGTCTIPSPGWKVLRKIEADCDGLDRFRDQTCDLVPGVSTIFFPSKRPPENRVLVFFAAEEPSYHLPCHAARAAAEADGWILVAVNSTDRIPDWPNNPYTVTAEQICQSLENHGYKTRSIDRLRVASHSRGSHNMATNLGWNSKPKLLVARGASGDIVDMSKLERLVSFDSDVQGQLASQLGDVGIDMSIVFGFHATTLYPRSASNPGGALPSKEAWTLPTGRTVQLSSVFEPIVSPGVVGLTRLRLLDDVRALHSELAIPPGFTSLLDGIVLAEGSGLPPLGDLTSHNILAFCTDNQTVLARAAASEELRSFLDQAPATGYNAPLTSVFQHQMFLAEFFREATSKAPPKVPSA